MVCDSQFLKNFWMGRKKLLTKPIAGGKINRLLLETTTKKNKKFVEKDKCFRENIKAVAKTTNKEL